MLIVRQNYYFQELIPDLALLSRAEEIELSRSFKAGDQRAKNKLVEHNLKLVFSVLKNYRSYKVDFEDLFQEGVIGLSKAIEKFDPTMGFKLSTYAVWWIRQAIQRALARQLKPAKLTEQAQELENKTRVEHLIGTDEDQSPEHYAENRLLEESVRKVLSSLRPRERIVMQLRYGIDHDECLNKKETAEALNISLNKVSNLEQKSIEKLRSLF